MLFLKRRLHSNKTSRDKPTQRIEALGELASAITSAMSEASAEAGIFRS